MEFERRRIAALAELKKAEQALDVLGRYLKGGVEGRVARRAVRTLERFLERVSTTVAFEPDIKHRAKPVISA